MRMFSVLGGGVIHREVKSMCDLSVSILMLVRSRGAQSGEEVGIVHSNGAERSSRNFCVHVDNVLVHCLCIIGRCALSCIVCSMEDFVLNQL